MDRNEMWARMAELDAKDELTPEEQKERDTLETLDWWEEQEDIKAYMYGY